MRVTNGERGRSGGARALVLAITGALLLALLAAGYFYVAAGRPAPHATPPAAPSAGPTPGPRPRGAAGGGPPAPPGRPGGGAGPRSGPGGARGRGPAARGGPAARPSSVRPRRRGSQPGGTIPPPRSGWPTWRR